MPVLNSPSGERAERVKIKWGRNFPCIQYIVRFYLRRSHISCFLPDDFNDSVLVYIGRELNAQDVLYGKSRGVNQKVIFFMEQA